MIGKLADDFSPGRGGLTKTGNGLYWYLLRRDFLPAAVVEEIDCRLSFL